MKRTYYDASSDDNASSGASSAGSDACCRFLGLNKRAHLSDEAYVSRGGAAATQLDIDVASKPRSMFDVPYSITDGERLLAQEMTSLSLDDRETVYEDIHGIIDAVEETPELVKTKLEELEESIKATRKKDAYNKAAFLSQKAVRNDKMRIQMLRTGLWDVEKATKLVIKHFDYKLRLFGEEKFIRPIRWDDLPQDARDSLEAGSVVQYEGDSNDKGRSMMILNYASFKYTTPESLLMSMYYSGHATNDPSEAARKGMIAVINTVGSKASQVFMAIQATQRLAKWGLTDSLSMRFTSNHFILGETWMRPYISMLVMSISKETRLRTRFHMGSFMENLYELGQYGIPLSMLPFDGDGQPNREVLARHIKRMRSIDDEQWYDFVKSKPPNKIYSPKETDVVLGRGWPYQSFPGNLKLMEFLEREKYRYDEAPSRMEKTLVTATLVVRIRKTGVRFLKRDESGDYWEEVSDTAARQKVAMSIRNIGRR